MMEKYSDFEKKNNPLLKGLKVLKKLRGNFSRSVFLVLLRFIIGLSATMFRHFEKYILY